MKHLIVEIHDYLRVNPLGTFCLSHFTRILRAMSVKIFALRCFIGWFFEQS